MNRPLLEKPLKPETHAPGLMTKITAAAAPQRVDPAQPAPENGPMAPMTKRAADRHARNAGAKKAKVI